ncbi:hypothetical protein [Metabacillus fastidiosus]|uniref:hypothetical protein n=1 Tax=Metabacillus fastidiosus TaxID=1458 RepID=UPI002E2024D7|nr:hypothetical protein [Metabacillus fastidiosus]
MKKKKETYRSPTILNLLSSRVAESLEFQCLLLETLDSIDMKVFTAIMKQHTFSFYSDTWITFYLSDIAEEIFIDITKVNYIELMNRIEKLHSTRFSFTINGSDGYVFTGSLPIFQKLEMNKNIVHEPIRIKVEYDYRDGMVRRYIEGKFKSELQNMSHIARQISFYIFDLRLREYSERIKEGHYNLDSLEWIPLDKKTILRYVNISKNWNIHREPIRQALAQLVENNMWVTSIDIKHQKFYIQFSLLTDNEIQEMLCKA